MRHWMALGLVFGLASCGDNGSGTDGPAGGGDMAKAPGDMAMGGGGDMAKAPGDMAMGGGGDMAMTSMVDLATNVDLAGFTTPTCKDYCTALQANCKGNSAQFASNDACNATCTTNSGWPIGTLADTSDTLGCREARALAAKADPTDNCNAGGIEGDNVCGTWCENYCYLALRNCTGGNQIFADANSCMTACAQIPSDPTMPNAQAGNSLQCRIYHLNNAGGSPALAIVHCPHANPTPTGPCM